MSIDYGAEIPEINSGRIYAGAGSGPLMATAAAWEEQAAELMAGAAQLAGVLGTLTTNWQGPSSEAMVASIAPYLAWMLKTSETAQHAAATHAAAAMAHDAAFMGVVPPPVITANQTALAAAIGGLPWTAPQVAELEAQYQEMWAQDATTLYTYSSSMTAAIGGLESDATTPALPTTIDGGVGAMADSSSQAAGQVAGNAAQTASSAGNQASSMGSAASSLGGVASSAGQALTSPLNSVGQLGNSLASPLSSMMSSMGGMNGLGSGAGVLPMMSGFGSAGSLGSLGSLGSVGSGANFGGAPMMANMGGARSLPSGRLSVPSGWTGSVESSAVRPLSSSGLGATPMISEQPEVYGSGNGRPPTGMPMMAGMGSGGTSSSTHYGTPIKVTGKKKF
jgi:PPE-repeat protein